MTQKAFILWRENKLDGHVEYVTGWSGDGAAHSSNPEEALKYATREAAEFAIAARAPGGWQIQETQP